MLMHCQDPIQLVRRVIQSPLSSSQVRQSSSRRCEWTLINLTQLSTQRPMTFRWHFKDQVRKMTTRMTSKRYTPQNSSQQSRKKLIKIRLAQLSAQDPNLCTRDSDPKILTWLRIALPHLTSSTLGISR